MSEQENKQTGIGVGKMLAYCAGQFGGNIFNLVFVGWIVYFYTTAHSGHDILVKIGWIGAAQIAGRFIDAISDLGVGYWSDNTKTRLGRRRPFILLGTPLITVTFFLLWNPPFAAGSSALIAYVFVIMGVFWFAFTVMMAPYLALMPEICKTSRERVGMSTQMTIFMMLAQVYQGIAVPQILKFSNFKTMAIISGVIGFVFMMIPGVFIKEQPAPEGVREEKHKFIDAIRWTFTNPAFVIYIISSVFIYFGFAAVTASIPFIVTRLFGKPLEFVTTVYVVMFVGFIAAFLVVNKLTKKMEKARLYRWSIIGISVTMPLMFFIGRVHFPFDTSKIGFAFALGRHVLAFHLWDSTATMGIALMLVMALPIAANMILPMAILADIIDYDEKLTGFRREAIFMGCQGFLQKAATAVSAGLQALLFGVFGYSLDNHLGVNLLGPVAGVLSFIGFLVFLLYPLDEKTKDLKQAVRALLLWWLGYPPDEKTKDLRPPGGTIGNG